jgi:hypothetical protein
MYAFPPFTMDDFAVVAAVEGGDNHHTEVEGMQGNRHNLRTFHKRKHFVVIFLIHTRQQILNIYFYLFLMIYIIPVSLSLMARGSVVG